MKALPTLAAIAAIAVATGAAAAQTPAVSAPPVPAAAAAVTPAAPPSGPNAGGREAQALTTLITGLQSGTVDYSRLDKRVGDALRPQQAALSGRLAAKGPLQNLEDNRTQEGGLHRITARFEKDTTVFWVALDARGQIAAFTMRD